MDEWKTIEPGVWKPEIDGDNIIGVLINKEPKDEQTGFSARYYLENEKGMFFVWGSTVLDDRMQYVKAGQKTKITFEGKTKNKRGQNVNLFRVEVSDNQAKNDLDHAGSDGKSLNDEELVVKKEDIVVI